MLFSYVPFGVTVMVLGCPDYLQHSSIITAWNIYKDVQDLQQIQNKTHNFYSVDKLNNIEKKQGKTGKIKGKLLKIAKLINYIRALLWKQPLFSTEKLVAGKLYLCIGMPVMIRNNSATEVCITKGQEGTVAGLQSIKGPHGKVVLDTIFVKLDNLPQPVKFDKLRLWLEKMLKQLQEQRSRVSKLIIRMLCCFIVQNLSLDHMNM
jgi:hypothetical protein